MTGRPNDHPPEFISEPITPEAGTFSTDMMSQGLASLPRAFTWREQRYEITECLEHYKESTPEGGKATGERYLRRQYFVVMLDTDQRATLYVQRQGAGKQRWFLYTIEQKKGAEGPRD